MNNLFEPLSDEELDYLDHFLLDRIDEDAATADDDEGVIDISELDGLFAAIVSGPETILPSRWLPLVWGDCEPVWKSEKGFERIMNLMMRHMNSIARMLLEARDEFEPLFMGRVVGDNEHVIVDEWCEGYCRGVALAGDRWEIDLDMQILLVPIRAFTSETEWMGHTGNDEEVRNVQKAITPNVREIYAYWLARREQSVSTESPVQRSEVKVGRNDPCPCGSGKKYKKCCLH